MRSSGTASRPSSRGRGRPRSWRALCAITSASGASESSPATGSGHSATTRPSSTTTMPPPISRQVLDGEDQVVVAHAEDDEIVGVVGDRRGERAAPQTGAGDEAEPDPSGREVTLDDGDLGQAGFGVCHRIVPRRRQARARDDSVTTWSSISPIARIAAPSERIAKSAVVTGLIRTVWRTHSGTGGDGMSTSGRPRLRTRSGMKPTRSGSSRRSAR